jgi:crotonobetainyl-CoA:carnitine CoA-transferase CaiB-like acyl-CoA transferase
MNPLEGIKIVDFTRLLPGPLATHLLAQMGADVIKVESPKRMDYIRYGIGLEGSDIMFNQLNHNKTSLIIDYNMEVEKKRLLNLIKESEVVIEQFRPGAMNAWGFGYEDLKKINPEIIYLSLTGYGQEGNYSNEAGHDFNYLAIAGIMGLLKDDNGKPTVPDTQFSDIGASYMAVIALQAALIKKYKTGKGSFVDVNLCTSVTPFLTVPYALHSEQRDYRSNNVINGKTTVNYATYKCSDGKYLSVGALEIKFWENICNVLGKPEWIRKTQLELMNSNFPKNEIEAIFLTKTRDEWTTLFKGKDCCIAPILEIEELENHPYHKEMKTFETFKTPKGEHLKTISLPFKITE